MQSSPNLHPGWFLHLIPLAIVRAEGSSDPFILGSCSWGHLSIILQSPPSLVSTQCRQGLPVFLAEPCMTVGTIGPGLPLGGGLILGSVLGLGGVIVASAEERPRSSRRTQRSSRVSSSRSAAFSTANERFEQHFHLCRSSGAAAFIGSKSAAV